MTLQDKNSNRKALGRGLGALIPGKSAAKANFFECPIERVEAQVGQPRRLFRDEALEELSASILANGVIQPLVVREDGPVYRLIAGERRLRAARLAGLTTVPVVIKDVDDAEAFELALIENIQREDLNPLEEAESYQRLMEVRSYTQEQLAQQLGCSRSTISNALRLLRLEPDVRLLIEDTSLSAGAARALLSVADPAEQVALARASVEHQLAVRAIEAVVRRIKDGAAFPDALDAELNPAAEITAEAAPLPSPAAPIEAASDDAPPAADDRGEDAPAVLNADDLQADKLPEDASAADRKEIRRWTEDLSARLGARVKMKVKGRQGSIQLLFNDRDELEALLRRLLTQEVP